MPRLLGRDYRATPHAVWKRSSLTGVIPVELSASELPPLIGVPHLTLPIVAAILIVISMLAVDRHGDRRAFHDGMIILMVFSLKHVRGTAGSIGRS